MASYKNLQASRPKRDSHFSYSTERMTCLTSTEATPARQKRSAVLSVQPDQDPVERTAEADGGGEESSKSSLSSDLQINTEALSKLQVTQNYR